MKNCPTCGSPVYVVGGGEGTWSYEPVASRDSLARALVIVAMREPGWFSKVHRLEDVNWDGWAQAVVEELANLVPVSSRLVDPGE